jgi:NADH dehydrogenase FAD-containing subunit
MKHQIVVLGAGYAGANAAARLAKRLHPDVYAVGDAAHARGANGTPLRMSSASGVPAAHLAAAWSMSHPTSMLPVRRRRTTRADA